MWIYFILVVLDSSSNEYVIILHINFIIHNNHTKMEYNCLKQKIVVI